MGNQVTRKSDDALGMNASISRRDLLHGAAAGLAATLPGFDAIASTASANATQHAPAAADYPPVRTGMRGSHPGAFEAAHALAREGSPSLRPGTWMRPTIS